MRLLLRLLRFKRPPPPPSRPVASSHCISGLQQNLICSSLRPLLRGVLGNIRWWFGEGSQHSSTHHLSKQKSPPKKPHDHENRVCTNVLIAVNILVHVVDVGTKRKLIMWGGKVNDLIRAGQIWRMATASLLHVHFLHLACNIISLARYGPMLEGYIGPRRFLAVYCTSALSGSLLSYWYTPAPSVGASDAICGLIGAVAVYSWRHRHTLIKANETLADIAFMVLFNLVIAIFTNHSRIDHWAHETWGMVDGGTVIVSRTPTNRRVPIQYTMLTDSNNGLWAVKEKVFLHPFGMWPALEGWRALQNLIRVKEMKHFPHVPIHHGLFDDGGGRLRYDT